MLKSWMCIAVLSATCALTYSQGCLYQGYYFQPGQFQPEPCLSCFCYDGGVTDCFTIQCPTCLFYYYKPGDCCATCEPPPLQGATTPPGAKAKYWEPEEPNESGI